MATSPDLWLEPVPGHLQRRARDAFANRDVVGFLGMAANDYGLHIVFNNIVALRAIGKYEEALLLANLATRVNHHNFSLPILRWMFELADRKRLAEVGDPISAGERFVLYRGVAGHGRARRVRGIAWTDNLERAWWFACRLKLADPAVFSVTIERSDVCAYSNARQEREYVVLLPDTVKPKRVPASAL